MTNDQYLVVSYVFCASLSIALGAGVYRFLRRPLAGIAGAAPNNRLGSLLNKLFPVGILFPALLGFVSVSYYGCDRETYAKIVESRSYLVEKNQAQISSTLMSIVVAVLVWDALILLATKIAQRKPTPQ